MMTIGFMKKPEFVMSKSYLSYPASAIAGKACLSADDVALLRRYMFPVGLLSTADAAQLIALHRASPETSTEWDNWFVETIAGFLVARTEPRGSLDAENARFMIQALSTNDIIATGAELDILLHAMELAAEAPEELVGLALDQLRIALQLRQGAYADQRCDKRSGIAQCDIDYVYRVLRGSVHNGRMVLHRGEIAAIEKIDAIVRGETNHPAWYFLIKSIAVRDGEGRASPEPWLRMVATDVPETEEAA